MSRSYSMFVRIAGIAPGRVEAVKVAACEEWSFDDWHDHEGTFSAVADGSLCAGETEEDFADRLAEAIWKANEAFCAVEIQATYLDMIPHEDHSRDEEDYLRLIGKEVEPTKP